MTRNKFEKAFGDAHPHLKYEALRLKYTIEHQYTPDWIDPETGAIFETKGRFVSADRSKHLAIKSQHPDIDITMVFMKPNLPLYKGSKTTYAQWCDKHGIKWLDGSEYAKRKKGK
ncbi:endodeoxyribonuclease [Agrobacterium tumefaciens]|uniref:Endodeoxyribonuclease n=1 Tax=Agrobacterium tumefaciens TaxID=358 RepID=A0AA44F7Y2_AGRTU|nr:endodeoxyribonuclease [Agrobacterium tumefaciens]NTB86865.1 endodeoxyribonuclease [Agrobacterium tumefaciens]NTC21194.1 endodeoxyribonuclease [Agrobacterium tumefaciens]NTC30742.1 endodeoxyribonuclease [Agrobacterium tumefaciens]